MDGARPSPHVMTLLPLLLNDHCPTLKVPGFPVAAPGIRQLPDERQHNETPPSSVLSTSRIVAVSSIVSSFLGMGPVDGHGGPSVLRFQDSYGDTGTDSSQRTPHVGSDVVMAR
jgi:hypothetical protein